MKKETWAWCPNCWVTTFNIYIDGMWMCEGCNKQNPNIKEKENSNASVKRSEDSVAPKNG